MLKITEGKDSDAYELVGRLRQQDWNELWASNGKDPDETLLESWETSVLRWSVYQDGKLVCIFGVSSSDELPCNVGIPWLVGSDELKRLKKSFVKKSARYITVMLSKYNYLINFVDTRNSLSIKWLQWLGFEFYEPQPFGPFHMPFMMFTLRKENDV